MGGGASGLSLLIYYATGETISIGVMVFIINAILLLIAGFIVGWKFGIKTIFCVCMLSFAMSTMQALFTQPDGTVMDIFNLDNRLLSTILAGIFSGVGVAMSFAQGENFGRRIGEVQSLGAAAVIVAAAMLFIVYHFFSVTYQAVFVFAACCMILGGVLFFFMGKGQ